MQPCAIITYNQPCTLMQKPVISVTTGADFQPLNNIFSLVGAQPLNGSFCVTFLQVDHLMQIHDKQQAEKHLKGQVG